MKWLLSLIEGDGTRRGNTRILPNGPIDESNKVQQDRLRLDKELDQLETKTWCIDFYHKVHRKAKIHFRLFIEIDGRRVVLASTQAPAVDLAPTSGRPHLPSHNSTE